MEKNARELRRQRCRGWLIGWLIDWVGGWVGGWVVVVAEVLNILWYSTFPKLGCKVNILYTSTSVTQLCSPPVIHYPSLPPAPKPLFVVVVGRYWSPPSHHCASPCNKHVTLLPPAPTPPPLMVISHIAQNVKLLVHCIPHMVSEAGKCSPKIMDLLFACWKRWDSNWGRYFFHLVSETSIFFLTWWKKFPLGQWEGALFSWKACD